MFTFTTDSAVDVFVKDLEAAHVKCIPLTYTVNGQTYRDIAEDDSSYIKFYDELKAGAMPVTSQINPYEHEEFWEQVYAEEKRDIVHLSLSGGLSQTYASACRAAESFNSKHDDAKVYVVDSIGATRAEAPIYEKALVLRDEGVDAATAAETLRNYAHRIQVYIIADDLFHLKRGGRVSAAAAVVGSMFSIKPVIVFDDEGHLCVYKKPVGWKKALKTVLDHIEEYCPDPASKKIWIAHADAPDKAAEAEAAIKARFGSKVQVGWIGRVIGAHTGAGTIGVLFEANGRLNVKN